MLVSMEMKRITRLIDRNHHERRTDELLPKLTIRSFEPSRSTRLNKTQLVRIIL